MVKLFYVFLMAFFLAPAAFAEDPKTEAPKQEPPAAKPVDTVKPECEEVMAQLKEAKAVHKTDYKAKGKAYYNWRKYYKQLHSESYLNTDMPLADSAKKCEEGDGIGKDFCKGALEEYNKISAKEKPAKEQLDAAEAKSSESRQDYNNLLAEANEKGCLVKQ